MATTASTRGRRPHVTPSLVKSETFLFALLVVGLAIYVPYMLKTGGAGGIDGRLANTTVPAFSIPDALGGTQTPLVLPPTSGRVPPPSAPVTGTGPAQAGAPPGDQRQAPITYILPYVLAFGRGVLSFIARLPVFIYRVVHTTIFRPLYYPLAFILAVIRPITLLLEVIYAVLLRTPLAILSWFIREAIYPIYVFTGIAAILGVTFGYSASHIPRTVLFATEQIRSRIAQSQNGQPALLTSSSGSATPKGISYSNGGSFRRRQGAPRSVSFNDVDDDSTSGHQLS